MTTEDEPRISHRVGALIETAMSTMDKMAGVVPATRPAHLAQLGLVLTAAAHEAQQADDNPGRVARDADLWRLREPGYLRAICEHPVGGMSGALVLLPVVLTWFLLGVAELLYVQHYTAIPADRRPSFFADWLVQPWYRGPFALSAVIVLTVGCVMVNHHRSGRQQRTADRLDRLVHQLEVDLLPPLTILRSRMPQGPTPVVTRAAAADLSRAAGLFVTATERLADSMVVVDKLSTVVDEYTAVLYEGATQLGLADRVAEHTEQHRAALEAARGPFVDAVTTIAATAGKLDATMAAAADLAAQLGEVIKNVNWLTLVADGLRDGDRPTDHQPDGPVAAR